MELKLNIYFSNTSQESQESEDDDHIYAELNTISANCTGDLATASETGELLEGINEQDCPK